MKFEVKYVGPRVHISHLGVDFKEGKNDKFLYIPYALEILQSIDTSFSHDKVYIHTPLKKQYSSDEILDIVLKYEPNVVNTIKEEI